MTTTFLSSNENFLKNALNQNRSLNRAVVVRSSGPQIV